MAPRLSPTQSDTDKHLLDMRTRGFHFAAGRDGTGGVVDLVAVRAHHGVIDVVEIYAENDVLAFRIPGDEPDIMCPSTLLWQSSGRAREVLNNLLHLADPPPTATTTSTTNPGCWLQTAPGHSTWLPADKTEEIQPQPQPQQQEPTQQSPTLSTEG